MDQALAVMKDLAASPHTANHIATKLARHFVADEPPPTLVTKLQHTYLGTGGDLAEVAKTLVTAALTATVALAISLIRRLSVKPGPAG